MTPPDRPVPASADPSLVAPSLVKVPSVGGLAAPLVWRVGAAAAAVLALVLLVPAARAQVVDSTGVGETTADTSAVPDEAPARPAPVPLDPPGNRRIGLADALTRALAVSPEVAAASAAADGSDARYALARASRYLTTFRVETAHSLAPGLRIPDDNTFPLTALYLNPGVRDDWGRLRPFNRISVDILQPLWTWGELSGSIDAAKDGARSDRAAVDVARQTVALRLAETYQGLRLARHLDGLARETARIVGGAKNEIQRLVDEGDSTVTSADVYELRLAEQQLRRQATEVRERLATARSALALQLFDDGGAPLAPADTVLVPIPFVRDSLGVYLGDAADQRAEIRQADAGIAARRALVRVARSDLYPKLGLGVTASYSYVYGRPRQRTPYLQDPYLGRPVRPGLGLRQNLAFGQTRARIRQAEAALRQTEALGRGARQLAAFETEEGYRSVVIAEDALSAADTSLAIAREWERDAQIGFDLGLTSARELVRATRARLDADIDRATRVERYNVAVLRLVARTGGLTPEAARTLGAAATAADGTLLDE